MKKITRFILMIAFIISAVQCMKNELLDNLMARPGSPFLNPHHPVPDETGSDSESSEFHIYTDREKEQIRQSVIGRYRGFLDNQETILVIRTNNTVFITSANSIQEVSNYSILLLSDDEPSITFKINKIIYEFDLQFRNNSYTEVIGLRSTDHPIECFTKIQNVDVPHDEL